MLLFSTFTCSAPAVVRRGGRRRDAEGRAEQRLREREHRVLQGSDARDDFVAAEIV